MHSPFVFDLVTKCFYVSEFSIKNSIVPSNNKLILKTTHYLNLENCLRYHPEKKIYTKIDALIISVDFIKEFSINKILPYCKNETCIFIENIHQNKANTKIWKQLHQHESVTCSIETFNLGMLFLRKEQQKEHFIINANKTISSHLFERIRI